MRGFYLAVQPYEAFESMISREYGRIDREDFISVLESNNMTFSYNYEDGGVWCLIEDAIHIPPFEPRFSACLGEFYYKRGSSLNPIDLTT